MNFKDNYRINWPNEFLKPCWRVTEMEDWSEKTADSPIEIKWREITATLESSRSYINLTQIYFISISSLKCIFYLWYLWIWFQNFIELCDFYFNKLLKMSINFRDKALQFVAQQFKRLGRWRWLAADSRF